MKQLLIALMLVAPVAAQAECKREFGKPVAQLNEAELSEEERKLLVELREIEADPELQKQAKEVAENWKSYGFTECPVPELD